MGFFFFLYFLFLPFQFALSPAPGIDLAMIRLVSLVGLTWFGVQGLVHRKLVLPVGLETFFLTGVLLVSGLSLFWANNVLFAARKFLFLLSFLPLFGIWLSRMKESPQDRDTWLYAYVLGATLLASAGLGLFFLQFFIGVPALFVLLTENILPFFLGSAFGSTVAAYPSLLVNVSGVTLLRASGVFPDPHMFAYYVGMAIPLAFAFSWNSTRQKRLWWWVITGILFSADLFSFSRGGYVGLGVAILFAVLVANRFTAKQWWGGSILMITLFILISLSPLGSRAVSVFSFEEGSNSERLQLWKDALVHVGEQPLFGVGLGNYPLAVKPTADYREPIYAHNVYLDIVLETGLIGLFLWLGWFLLILAKGLLVWQKRHDGMVLGIMTSFVIFLTHSFFENPLFSVHVLPLVLFLGAAAFSFSYEKNQ